MCHVQVRTRLDLTVGCRIWEAYETLGLYRGSEASRNQAHAVVVVHFSDGRVGQFDLENWV